MCTAADCTTAPAARAARPSCRPPLTCLSLQKSLRLEVTAREREGERPASRGKSESHPILIHRVGVNECPCLAAILSSHSSSLLFLRSDCPADPISGAAFIQRRAAAQWRIGEQTFDRGGENERLWWHPKCYIHTRRTHPPAVAALLS